MSDVRKELDKFKAGSMPEDISEVAGLGPLERPRVGKTGIRLLKVSKALDMLEDAIVDGRRVASDYRQLARELEEVGFPVEANLVAAVRVGHLGHVQTLEGIRNVVRGRK